MNDATNKPTAEQVDNYILAQHNADLATGTLTAQILQMARDAASNEATRGSLPILHRAAWEMAAWEVANS